MKTKKYVRIKQATVDGVWYVDKIGQVFEVEREGPNYFTRTGPHHLSAIRKEDAEVIVNNETRNEEADEMKNGKTRYDLAVENAREAIEELRLVAYEQGYEDARRQLNAKAPTVSAQARRDEIVEQAKVDLENLADEDGPAYQTEDNEGYPCSCYASFRVNKEHRTVACDLRGVRTGERYKRGIAKAAPDDCFNVHIGKAIALRRALGLAVPDEYLNAPQPTEVRVGDVIMPSVMKKNTPRIVVATDAEVNAKANTCCPDSIMATNKARIIDDSHEEVCE
ncbi:hypothetical protein P9E09_06945 [Bacillus mojavensis]|uniref:hypothetical protein n=1 Tax=Bacillus mojavensis TaxID=72360 RepID=UPI002DB605BF|nr:hypothetical protein [Bacillus mojavensis]MEC1707389.1 hypothetical protein [Bacillus mojavensis]